MRAATAAKKRKKKTAFISVMSVRVPAARRNSQAGIPDKNCTQGLRTGWSNKDKIYQIGQSLGNTCTLGASVAGCAVVLE